MICCLNLGRNPAQYSPTLKGINGQSRVGQCWKALPRRGETALTPKQRTCYKQQQLRASRMSGRTQFDSGGGKTKRGLGAKMQDSQGKKKKSGSKQTRLSGHVMGLHVASSREFVDCALHVQNRRQLRDHKAIVLEG